VPRRVLRYVLSVDAGKKPQIQPVNKKPATPAYKAPPTAVAAPIKRPTPLPIPIKKPAVTITVTPILEEPSKIEPALRIISEESGVAISDLTDDCVFADIGIDSLLSLVITSRFREELGLDIGLDDMFTNYPVVKDLREFLVPDAEDSSIGSQTPALGRVEIIAPTLPDEDIIQTVDIVVDADFDSALAIISEESGVAISDLTDDCIFSDLGIDSLLSLVIVSRFREELALDMEMESVFTDYPTVKDLKCLLATGGSGDTTRTPSPGIFSSDEASSSESEVEEETPCLVPAATSVILQGTPKTAQRTLFLFPDGAGSATSYSSIPRVDTQTALIGLNSPYYRNPAAFKCTVDALIASYITELRRRQPYGPYNLGGWSAGGILAYRAAQSLIESGEVVKNLILIDSPVPTKGLDRLPQHFYDFCNKVHLFGEKPGNAPTSTAAAVAAAAAPEWLVPHFNATIDTLHSYHAKPLSRGRTPDRTSLIWACDTVMDGIAVPKMPPHPDDTEGMKFLTEPRTDFSPCGWETLLPGGEVSVHKATGANHFTMMVSSLTPSRGTSTYDMYSLLTCLCTQKGDYAPKLRDFIHTALA
jgi:thioesterase domain-containing protein/acyl carrier protein